MLHTLGAVPDVVILRHKKADLSAGHDVVRQLSHLNPHERIFIHPETTLLGDLMTTMRAMNSISYREEISQELAILITETNERVSKTIVTCLCNKFKYYY